MHTIRGVQVGTDQQKKLSNAVFSSIKHHSLILEAPLV